MGEAENLAVVAEHMAGEATDPASIMALYTDDVLFEVPSRAIALRDLWRSKRPTDGCSLRSPA